MDAKIGGATMLLDGFPLKYAISVYVGTVIACIFFVVLICMRFNNEQKKLKILVQERESELGLLRANRLSLDHEKTVEFIDYVIEDVWKNKYLLYYRLKDIRVIPKMDEEVKVMATEILSSFSDDFKSNAYKYFSKEFMVQMITRKCQILLIEYTNQYKPNTK